MPITRHLCLAAVAVCCIASLCVLLAPQGTRPAHAGTGPRLRQAPTASSPSPSSRDPHAPTAGATAEPSTTATATPTYPDAPTSAPSPPASPTAPSVSDEGSDGCGLFDVACRFRQAINGFFRGLVSYGLNPVFRFLARSVLSTPRVDQLDRVQTLWATSAWIANTCFVLLIVAGGVLLMGYQSLQTSYTAKDVAPRLVMAMVAANVNLPLIGQAIEFTNALSQALMGPGVDEGKAANTLKGLVVHALTDGHDIFISILALVAVVAGLVVLFTYAIRIMLLVLLAAAAPLALACHALPQTEGLARLWWRAVAGVLAIQVAQALVFATAVRVFFTSDQMDLFGIRSGKGTFDLVLVICLLYILARIPAWVSQMIFRGGIGRSPLVRLGRTLAAVLIFRRLTGRRANGRTATPMRQLPPPPPPPPTTPVVPPPSTPPAPPSWTQPQLPFPPPSPGGRQLELPFNPAPQPRTPQAAWRQLRLPGVPASPPRWQQTALPIRPRYVQTRLPTPPPRRYAQPELPLRFPPPGSPQAAHAPRRLADTAALRDARTRARRGTPPNPSSAAWRNS